jgi:hypothetical protein
VADQNQTTIILSKRELEALEELANWNRRGPYWWRQASMRKLSERGFVQRSNTHGSPKLPAWIITDAGIDHLKGFPKP